MQLPGPLNILVDILMFTFGTYGAIILVGAFVEFDQLPSPSQIWQVFRKQWKAALAFLIANLLFFLRVYAGIAR